jgi:hypothetical protein
MTCGALRVAWTNLVARAAHDANSQRSEIAQCIRVAPPMHRTPLVSALWALRLAVLGVLAFGTALTVPHIACAQEASAEQGPALAPISDRNFSIDLFEQPAIGSPRLIGMAGAINSVAEGSGGLFTNPASPAVRPETRSEKFAWNVYLSSYIPTEGQDTNNNGQAVTDVRRSLVGAAGLLLQYGDWGLSLDGGYTSHEIAPEAGGGLGIRSIIGHLAIARTFLDDSLAVGLSVRVGALNVFGLDGGETLFTRGGASGQAGVVWKPAEQAFRLAVGGGLPVYTGALDSRCNPLDCYGYILPEGAVVPWDMIVGAAWRFGPTPWNHEVSGAFRDERALTVALDLSITGPVERGYGMEAFAAKQLQPSGRDLALTPRLGLEAELIPGWLRLRGGTYYEDSRFQGISSRPHGTTGAEVRLFAFTLGSTERRVSLSAAGDIAPRYNNLGVSVGLWN